MSLVNALTFLSGIAFLVYGFLCASSTSMVADFQRFGLERLRILTGVLEILGGAGLLIGLMWTPALRAASAGLALLMLIAFAVRLHMRDGFTASSPSFLLMLLKLYIFIRSVRP